MEREIVLRGKRILLNAREFHEAARVLGRVPYNPRVKYYTRIEGMTLPVKDLVFAVLRKKGTGITRQDFTTEDAVRILRKLGFAVYEENQHASGRELVARFAGILSIGGNALEDEQRLYTR